MNTGSVALVSWISTDFDVMNSDNHFAGTVQLFFDCDTTAKTVFFGCAHQLSVSLS